MKRWKSLFLLAPIVAAGITPALSQDKNTVREDQYWVRYLNRLQLSEKWTLQTELEHRRYAFPDREQQWFLPRIQVSRKFGDGWDAGAGIVYVLQEQPQDGDLPVEFTRPEIRPHQEFNYKHGKTLGISHRYRLEERFIRKTAGNDLAEGYNFNFRFRYRLQFQYLLIKGADKKGTLQARVSDELMVNLGKKIVRNTFDQNRIYAGLNYSFSENFQLELGYMNIFQQKSNGDNFINTNVLRTTVYHTIKLYK